MIGLIRSEFLKIRTTNVWWILLLSSAGFTLASLAVNILAVAGPNIDSVKAGTTDASASEIDQALTYSAATIYTSGQYFGLLLAMIIGVLMVTNEFFHQTATATFLTTPKRTNVIFAKCAAALGWGGVFALINTVLSVPLGVLYLVSEDMSTYLLDGHVLMAILLNWLAYAVWAVFGLGLGTLLRNQIAAVVVSLVLYLLAENSLRLLLDYLANKTGLDWFLDVAYYLPNGASLVMTSPVVINHDAPHWWAGALTLFLYGAVAATIGTILTTRRDVT